MRRITSKDLKKEIEGIKYLGTIPLETWINAKNNWTESIQQRNKQCNQKLCRRFLFYRHKWGECYFKIPPGLSATVQYPNRVIRRERCGADYVKQCAICGKLHFINDSGAP